MVMASAFIAIFTVLVCRLIPDPIFSTPDGSQHTRRYRCRSTIETILHNPGDIHLTYRNLLGSALSRF